MDSSRLSPASRALLSDLKKVSGSSETALLEQAILHYYSHLMGKKALHSRLAGPLEVQQAEPTPEQKEVLSWLSDAFSGEPVPVESAPLPPLSLSVQGLKEGLATGVPPQPAQPATDAQGWALPQRPNLQQRRLELGMNITQLARESGLFEENIASLEGGGLLWLSLQEQWALASALNWSLEQLQEALEKNLL